MTIEETRRAYAQIAKDGGMSIAELNKLCKAVAFDNCCEEPTCPTSWLFTAMEGIALYTAEERVALVDHYECYLVEEKPFEGYSTEYI
tara:strand:+ start:258 stop:521 length:264 start_codon:yes stop_codon:yes gene_type:complete